MPVLNNWRQKYPKLPTTVANTIASKVIGIIKDRAIDPAFDSHRLVQRIQSWSTPTKKMAEWVMHVLSGAIRTMPEKTHPMAIVFQEALAESLTNIGIKIKEVSSTEQMDIIDATMPLVQPRLLVDARTDHQFRDRIDSILGSARDWKEVFQSAQGSLDSVDKKIEDHRTARKARGLRRFI